MQTAVCSTFINLQTIDKTLVWIENKEQTPLANAKELTAYIMQTIENHMLVQLNQGQLRDQKQDLKRIDADLAKLCGILGKIK